MSIFRGTASIILDDAYDVMHAGDATQGAENCDSEGKCRETGSEQNGSERFVHDEHEEGTGEKPKCRKMPKSKT